MFSLQVDSFYWTAEDRSIAVDVISSGTNDQYSNMLYVYDTGAEVHLFYARHLTNELNCFVPVQHFTHVSVTLLQNISSQSFQTFGET